MRRFGKALAVAMAMAGALIGFRANVKAVGAITLTQLATGLNEAIGIDWQSTSVADQVGRLIISLNYPTGSPNVFDSVNRTSGATATWGTYPQPFSPTAADEIYFASVRPGSQAASHGFTVGNVFSSPGAPLGCILQFDSTGAKINGPSDPFACVGTDDLFRGAIRFDDQGIGNEPGDLWVVQSHDQNGPASLFKINSAGGVTLVTTFADHTEGMTFIPTSAPAPYGGKVMVGHEFTGSVEFIDPNCSAPCNTSTTVAIGIPVEDLWFLQPNQDFYGVDHNESDSSAPPAGVGGTIWRAPAAQFVPYIGQVLVAREHKDATNDNLYALDLSTLAVTSLTGGAAQAAQWEHITFAPAPPPPPPPPPPPACGGATNPPCQTVTQGGWGAAPHGGNPGAILKAHFPAGGFAIGAIGVGSVCSPGLVATEFTFSTQVAVQSFLPQGGPPTTLTGGGIVANPTSHVTVLAGQVLALTINVYMSKNGVFQAGLGGFKPFTTGSAAGKTVDQILADANGILGGCATPASLGYSSYSDINDIVDAINNMFDS